VSQPFLVLHKVRGAPAFDIAEKIGEDSQGDIWIIPTSGHRAYPYWELQLDHLYFGGELPVTTNLAEMPEDHLDHYSCNAPTETAKIARKGLFDGQSLLARLGLTKKINRRF